MKTRGTWHDAFDGQMGLWRWVRTEHGQAFLQDGYRHTAKGFTPVDENDTDYAERGHALAAGLYGAEEPKLLTATPIFVSAEMCEVLSAAVAGFQPEPLYATDLMVHTGFVWYEKPWQIVDRFDEPFTLRGWSWCPMMTGDPSKGEQTYRGLAVTIYSDIGPQPEYPLGVVPAHLTPWWFGMSFDGNEVDTAGKPTGAAWWWRIAQVTLRLMQQRIAVTHSQQPDRTARREGQRRGFGAPEVLVVRLRREQSEPTEPSGEDANYSHRFIVGAHWRNQHYPSLGPAIEPESHRQIWISPYVKGPDDKPLVVKPRRAYTWDR